MKAKGESRNEEGNTRSMTFFSPSAFRLPPSAFRLPPSAFRLPPSAFCLPLSPGALTSRTRWPSLYCVPPHPGVVKKSTGPQPCAPRDSTGGRKPEEMSHAFEALDRVHCISVAGSCSLRLRTGPFDKLRTGVSGQGGAYRHPVLSGREQRPHRAHPPAASLGALEAAGHHRSARGRGLNGRRQPRGEERAGRALDTLYLHAVRVRALHVRESPLRSAERSGAGHARHRLAADDHRAPVAAGEQSQAARRARPRPPRRAQHRQRRERAADLLLHRAREGQDDAQCRTRAPGRSRSISWEATCRSAWPRSARSWGR